MKKKNIVSKKALIMYISDSKVMHIIYYLISIFFLFVIIFSNNIDIKLTSLGSLIFSISLSIFYVIDYRYYCQKQNLLNLTELRIKKKILDK